ncbi:MAG: hypothetical protein GXP45_07065 [bacterium]|nr:hypothetical protein [bacterium]
MITPIPGSVQTMEPIEVIGKVGELPNTTYQVYLNKVKVADGTTDGQGNFTSYVSNAVPGTNTIQVKAININAEVI